MLDFDVQRCTRKCAKTDREFRPGEWFYSVLKAEGGDVSRYDYCQEAWEGPPKNALGWWKSQMPQLNAKKMNWAPNEVMLHYFEQLEHQKDKQDIRYILALLMIRRRIVRLEETETDEENRQTMVLYCPRNETEYKVLVASPNQQRIGEIQNELAQLLFADAA